MGVFSRVVRTTIPVGAAAYTAYAYKDEIAADGIYGIAAPFRQVLICLHPHAILES